MKKTEKKQLETMLNSFESILEELETADPLQTDNLIRQLNQMDLELCALELIEA